MAIFHFMADADCTVVQFFPICSYSPKFLTESLPVEISLKMLYAYVYQVVQYLVILKNIINILISDQAYSTVGRCAALCSGSPQFDSWWLQRLFQLFSDLCSLSFRNHKAKHYQKEVVKGEPRATHLSVTKVTVTHYPCKANTWITALLISIIVLVL